MHILLYRKCSPLILLIALWILVTLSFLVSSVRGSNGFFQPTQSPTLASSVFTIRRGNDNDDDSLRKRARYQNTQIRLFDMRGGDSPEHIVEDSFSKQNVDKSSKKATDSASSVAETDSDSIEKRDDVLPSNLEDINDEHDDKEEEDQIMNASNLHCVTEPQSGATSETDEVVINEIYEDVESSSSTIDVEVVIQSDDDNDEDNDDETLVGHEQETADFVNDIEAIQNIAAELRVKGKKLHDEGDFSNASDTFQRAATELDDAISRLNASIPENDQWSKKMIEERATCRLHEALCHLKNKKYIESVVSCTAVLMDGVEVIVLDEEQEGEVNDGDNASGDYDHNNENEKIPLVQIYTNRVDSLSSTSYTSSTGANVPLSPAVRARAYHRRAKARLALGDKDGALDDSRSAAFLGDRNAVALYGRLMRESGKGGSSSWMNNSEGSLSNALMDDYGLFGGKNSNGSPFDAFLSGSSLFSDRSSSSGNSGGSTLDFFGSLLNSSGSESSMDSPAMPFNPLGLLGSMNGSNGSGGGGMEGLAKSVLSSVAKKAEDKETQEMICKYLNSVDTTQLMGLSTMAGMPLSQSTAERIVSFAKSVTPRGIGKSVKLTKRILFVGSLMRKMFMIVGKYKHLIVLAVLVAWIQSAIQRPVVTAVKRQAAKQAINAALSKSTFYI